MKRPSRISLASVGILCLAATVLTITATTGGAAVKASHPCVVAVGSGDTPFVRDFNPYHSFGNVGSDFTAGGIYENLVITTAFGGGHAYNVLAKSLTWSKDGKTLTITVQPNAKWSNGKPVTNKDVLYSLTIGKVDKSLDHIGLTAKNSNIAWVRLAGPGKVAIHFRRPTRRSSARSSRASGSCPRPSSRRPAT